LNTVAIVVYVAGLEAEILSKQIISSEARQPSLMHFTLRKTTFVFCTDRKIARLDFIGEV